MFVDPKTAFDITTAGLNLGTAITKLISESQKQGRELDAAEVISLIVKSSRDTAGDLLRELETLRADLNRLGVDINRKPDDIQKDWGFLKGKKYRAFNNYKNKVEGLVAALGSLHGQILAAAHCREAEEQILSAIGGVIEKRTERRAVIDSDKSLKDILDYLEIEAAKMKEEMSEL